MSTEIMTCDALEKTSYYVCYEILGQKVAAGPYLGFTETIRQQRDINKFEGVSGIWNTDQPPDEYRKL